MSETRKFPVDLSELIAIDSHVQITNIIEKAALFGGDIWQSVPGHKQRRELSRIVEIGIDKTSDCVMIRMPTHANLDPQLPIFVRLNYRNVIFRLFPHQYKLLGDKISCRYPAEARALEERKGGDRYVLPFQADISLSLKRIERTFKDLTYEMELRIIDISERGVGILISSQNKECLKKNDHFWLKSIDHIILRTPILGHVCYVAPKGYYQKRGDVRLGVSLSLPLSSEILESLKRRSMLVLSA